MRIDRKLDKVFRITITKKEGELICDMSKISFEHRKLIVIRIVNLLLDYMEVSSITPDKCQPPFKIEL